MAISKTGIRQGMQAARAAWGVLGLVAPPVNLWLLGMDRSGNADGAYFSRLFATREIALAFCSSGVLGPKATQTACRAGVVVDAVDVGSLVLARRAGRVSDGSYAFIGIAGVLAVAAGAYTSA